MIRLQWSCNHSSRFLSEARKNRSTSIIPVVTPLSYPKRRGVQGHFSCDQGNVLLFVGHGTTCPNCENGCSTCMQLEYLKQSALHALTLQQPPKLAFIAQHSATALKPVCFSNRGEATGLVEAAKHSRLDRALGRGAVILNTTLNTRCLGHSTRDESVEH